MMPDSQGLIEDGMIAVALLPQEAARLIEALDALAQSLSCRLVERDAVIQQQAERIVLLEQMLAPPGPRGMARLRRSSWYVRIARRLGLVG